MVKPLPGKHRAGVHTPFPELWPGFLADWNNGRMEADVRELGATAKDAFAEWCRRRAAGPSARHSTPRRASSPSREQRLAVIARADRLLAECRALQRAASAPRYKYQAGAKYVVYGLPHWPIVEATRATNDRPGVGLDWRLIGRQA